MALHYAFKPGREQSMQANAYFRLLASDFVERGILDMEPTQYFFEEEERPPMTLRVWTGSGNTVRLREMLPWLRAVCAGLARLEKSEDSVPAVIPPLMRSTDPSATCFIEMLEAESAFTKQERNILSVGVLAGESVLLSTMNVLFVRLAEGLHGLSIFDQGSWLIEDVPSDRSFAMHAAHH
jgi:hypothetical protein